MRRAALALLAVGIGVLAVAGSAPAPARPSEKEGIAAFETVKAVLQHPRCQNCHIPGDAPLFDVDHPHAMNVRRGPDGNVAHVCPGAPNWKLPPPEHKMVFIGLDLPKDIFLQGLEGCLV